MYNSNMFDLSDRKNCFYWQTDRNLRADDYLRIFLKRQEISDSILIDILRHGITSFSVRGEIVLDSPDENVLKGNVNIVRKATINGDRYLVRMHPRGVKNGYFFVEECAWNAAKDMGIPVPIGIEVHEASSELDMDFMICSILNGMTMDNYLLKNPHAERQLVKRCGEWMAKIHNIKVEGYGSFNNEIAKNEGRLIGLHKSYHDFIHTGLEENLDRLVRFEVVEQLQASAMAEIFEQLNFEPTQGPRLIHNDFADWNVLTNGEDLTAILDWDECHAGDPIADLACWSTFFPIERYSTFLDGYTSISSLPTDYEDRFHFYRLRYTISKMALRIKRFQVDKDEGLLQRLEAGKAALKDEIAWFHL